MNGNGSAKKKSPVGPTFRLITIHVVLISNAIPKPTNPKVVCAWQAEIFKKGAKSWHLASGEHQLPMENMNAITLKDIFNDSVAEAQSSFPSES